ncbi:MAG: GvpL/GvpF family gas vesicle protein [Candidatus Thiosymbion ectosymbiont of Robbea hypermnestra]|nr:GvpL/GvpF family gas vesicle protein [Candidatus Thiosymbion ectosymbiont of Robbea hypermnestra]
MTHPADAEGTVLAYAVLDAARPPPPAALHDPPEANLEIREVAGLRVLYSPRAPQPAASEPDIERLRTFYQVIAQLHARHDILPLRWGQWFASPQALTRAIAADAAGYKRQLARLAGATEMGIRFLATGTPSTPEAGSRRSPTSPGRAFLEQRRARYGMDAAMPGRQRRIEDICRESFAGLFREITSETAQGADAQVMIHLHFLIPRELVARFRQTYTDLQPPAGLRTLLTGPWPPFNFAA